MTRTQIRKLTDLVAEARYIVGYLGKIGHAAGAVAVLTHATMEWSIKRGGLKREGRYAENN